MFCLSWTKASFIQISDKSNLPLFFSFCVNWICALSKAPWLGTKSTCMSNKTIMGLYLCLLMFSHLTAILCNPPERDSYLKWQNATINCWFKICHGLLWLKMVAIVLSYILKYLNTCHGWTIHLLATKFTTQLWNMYRINTSGVLCSQQSLPDVYQCILWIINIRLKYINLTAVLKWKSEPTNRDYSLAGWFFMYLNTFIFLLISNYDNCHVPQMSQKIIHLLIELIQGYN